MSGMDLLNPKDSRASCSAWCPRAEHEDMWKTFQVGMFRERCLDIPSIEHENSFCLFFVSYSFLDYGLLRFARQALTVMT